MARLAAAEARACSSSVRPRGGKVSAQNRGVAASSGEIVGFSDANAVWQRDALRKLVRSFADPAVGYVTGQGVVRGRGRDEPRGRVLALRALGARAGVAARVRHGGQRADLRGAARRLGGPRAVVRPRPRAPVPDGAARPARGVRPRRGLGREAVEGHRGRVPAQGADAARRVGARLPRDAAAGRAGLLRRARLAPATALRERDPPCAVAGLERGAPRRGLGLSAGHASAARLAAARRRGSVAAPIPARASRTTTSS